MMDECYNCKSLMSCLHSGHVHLNDNMGLRCDFYEKEDESKMRKVVIIDGIVYKRIIDMED